MSGSRAVIGAAGDDDAGSFSGSAYVFRFSGSGWTEQAKLAASDGAASDQFGGSVAVSGATAMVGARADDDGGSNSGSAYVFTVAEPDSDGDGIPDDEDACPSSDTRATVVVDGSDTGVTNHLLSDGCTIADLITEAAAGASDHGEFVSTVASLTNDLKKAGIISGREKGAIQSAAAQAGVP